ncbi:Na+:solute symporter [Candidatus Aminicenantes bacterium AC-708-M15]|jgi:Na+/proline symporter|nr:Na+:solute symporter [SCandidatus Aminicenantes bacterium Aminicenantia_JdfR_composite]MCP2597454.1 Na+:solute symporter [Candidatus Aminicenantes bacterium AC-335-G13]MCP2604419.1 Na+:solute symporter [Candidatus Aminicenantes bacterium AC-708-M15]MCP2606281.1 Na+:solute symporter [Candidatus Aminicenantes bacterium AC-708-I09]MCP2619215.1 Na+:solute symporter [Candidatus Aminicenantes bacterium AC-335-K20]MCP2620862.1 Na+:solute symporter [Candidatus Aminicenantes bacterium AC-334-E05]
MQFSSIDWIFVFSYFIFVLSVGFYFSKKAGRNIENFFISGRSLPWWIAGTSMVATTFGADTPLAVTEIVAKNGIAGNWLWWNFILGGMMTVFLFSKLWRRSEVLTDIEFTELRYSGKPASILRGFRAVYLGLPVNCMIMAWGILAMSSILGVTFSFPKYKAIIISLIIAVFYSVLSGFWGVVVTDLFQFVIAMTGSIALAVISIEHVGGIEILKSKVIQINPEALNFFPSLSSSSLPFITFFVYIAIQWWATWYPGSEPGGGGYVAQRMLATKNEKHAVFATLWFNIAHYALRPWPWILVALCSLIVFPNLSDAKMGYPKMMVTFLPTGLKGLMIAAFFGAFMSTIDTHLNWGASYIVNDFYKRFIKKKASPSHYVLVSRITIIIIMIFAGFTAYWLESIKGAWELLIAVGAGTGLIYILRWYWWRINAWSEISAMVCSFITAVILLKTPLGEGGDLNWAYRIIITVGITTFVWIMVTLLTPPVDKEHLVNFYKKIHPPGIWKSIQHKISVGNNNQSLLPDIINWILGTILIYSALFGFGKLILLEFGKGIFFLLITFISSIALFKNLSKFKTDQGGLK